MNPVADRLLPSIVIVNFALVAAVLMVLGKLATARPLTELPGGRQNAAEFALDWFVDLSRRIHPGSMMMVAPFLATLVLLILLSNQRRLSAGGAAFRGGGDCAPIRLMTVRRYRTARIPVT